MRYAVPEKMTNREIKNFRKRFSMTQKELAELLNVSVKTVESWEREGATVRGRAVTSLRLIYENPELYKKIQIKEKAGKIRFWYMAGNLISTIIDVDYVKRSVEYKNYTTDVNRTAFGVRKEVTIDDFEDFLRSRCIPETRDGLKIYLKELNIPFYDPLLIIEKTQGRLAEDDYWIKVEK